MPTPKGPKYDPIEINFTGDMKAFYVDGGNAEELLDFQGSLGYTRRISLHAAPPVAFLPPHSDFAMNPNLLRCEISM